MTTLNFPSLLTSQNIRAFLRIIREGETGQTDDAYRTIVGGGKFDSFADHPRQRVHIPRLNVWSTAAGAYQFLERTWDDLVTRYGLDSFSPYNQDCGAIALINDAGALDDVIDGRLDEAIRKCARIWASLPGDYYGQGGISMQRARAVYSAWAGTLAEDVHTIPPSTQRPAPIEDRGQPARPEDVERITEQEEPAMAPALIMGLIGSLMEIFSPVVRAKLTKVLDKQTGDAAISGQVADKVISFAQQAAAQVLPGVVPPPVLSGAPAPAAPIDPVIAIGAVKSNAALAAQVEAQVSDYLDQLAPVLDRLERLDQAAWAASEQSMDAAAARSVVDATPDQDRVLTLGLIVMVGGVLVVLSGGIGMLIWLDKPYGELLTLAAAGVGMVYNKFGTRIDYRYGSSRSSAAKDVVIEELSTRRTRNA